MGKTQNQHWPIATLMIIALLIFSGCVGMWGGGGDIDPQEPVFDGGTNISNATPGAGQLVTLTAGASDPQGQALTYTWDDGNTAAGEFIGSGTTVLWSSAVAGAYTITCTVTDPDGNTATTSFSVSVGQGGGGGDNSAPAFVDAEGNPLELHGDVHDPVATQRILFSTMATDPDGDALTYMWSASGGGAFTDEAVDAESGEASAFWAADAAGNYTVTVTADDGKGGVAWVSAFMSLNSDEFEVGDLPTEFTTAGYETCNNCHADTVTGWMTTHHSDALVRTIGVEPGSYGYRNEHCYDCHAAGQFPAGDGGFIDYELTPEFANIQCESCHGYYSGAGAGHMPMQWDPGKGYTTDAEGNYIKDGFSYVYDEAYDGSEGYGCGLCHMGTRHGAFEEWMQSGHGNAPVFEEDGVTPEHNMTGSSCAKCHNGAEFVRVMVDGGDGEEIAPEDFDPSSARITCATCHDPHSSQFEEQLRVDSTGDVTIPFDDTVVSAGKANICMECHNGRRSRDDYNGRIQNGSGHFGPHGNPQAPVFWGIMGADLGGVVDYNTNHAHQSLSNACVDCHMYRADYVDADNPKQFGHEFVPKVEACQGCHTTATTIEDITGDMTAEFNQLLADFVDAWPAEWKDVTDPANPVLENRDTDPPTGAGPPRDDPDGNAYREALWNYVLAMNDGSHGAHNPAFIRSLLTEATARVLELNGAIVTQPQAGYVGKATCLGCHSGDVDEAMFDTHRHNHKLNPATAEFIGPWWMGSNLFDTINMDFSVDGGTYMANIAGTDYEVVRALGWGFEKWKQRYIVSHGNSWYITPAQHNMVTDEWVNYHTGDWDAATGTPTGPANSYDRRCAGCHTTGTNVGFFEDTGEWVMGVSEENVQCEACHGPGATHAGSMNPADIINPATDITDYDRKIEVCGACHGRGSSVAEMGGSNMGYPFSADGRDFIPGEVLTDFYTQSPGLWPDGHSKKHHQQYNDFLLSGHYASGFVTCWTCHDTHEPDAVYSNDLCLNCHSGDVPDLNAHTKHALAKQCIDCHMPFTAKSAIPYDVRSHAFDIVSPQVSLDNFNADPANVMPNSCMNGGCHGGPDALDDALAMQDRVDAFNTLWP